MKLQKRFEGLNLQFFSAKGRLAFCVVNPQEGDLRLSDPPSGMGAGGGARAYDSRVPEHLRAGSLFTEPPRPPQPKGKKEEEAYRGSDGEPRATYKSRRVWYVGVPRERQRMRKNGGGWLLNLQTRQKTASGLTEQVS
ncbi:hypothetical protein PoB_003016700 [Plakobranchus ocellatus]|uniref:Uncharacterized protein n=1 Tax=Plakobranchus ocellatus TaxID=259542 RepID=A0AAV4A9N9_9GAST|nr:hypothetical protein PoB_003016700 [Plakobranchus ocellatus]